MSARSTAARDRERAFVGHFREPVALSWPTPEIR